MVWSCNLYTNYHLHFPTPSLLSTMTSTLPSLHIFPRLLPRHHHASLFVPLPFISPNPLSTHALQLLSSILPLSLPLSSLHHPFPVSLPFLVSAFLPSILFLHRSPPSMPAYLTNSDTTSSALHPPSIHSFLHTSCLPPPLSYLQFIPLPSLSSMLPLLSSRLSSVYSKTMPLMSYVDNLKISPFGQNSRGKKGVACISPW